MHLLHGAAAFLAVLVFLVVVVVVGNAVRLTVYERRDEMGLEYFNATLDIVLFILILVLAVGGASASVTSFSRTPVALRAPLSSPPWPASITIIGFSARRGAGSGCDVGRAGSAFGARAPFATPVSKRLIAWPVRMRSGPRRSIAWRSRSKCSSPR